MNFGDTYITLFGYRIFEPMVIVTNFILLIAAIYCYKKLIRFRENYPSQMAWFMLIMGVSGGFGAAAHAIQHHYSILAFDIIFFISNTMNLFACFFCFLGSYTFYCSGKKTPNKWVAWIALGWVAILIARSLIKNEFEVIKINAGIVLVYSLVVHLINYKKQKRRGSLVVVYGIVVSFLSILVHSLKISLGEWFNHKDIAHVIMIIALLVIYRGVEFNSGDLYSQPKPRTDH